MLSSTITTSTHPPLPYYRRSLCRLYRRYHRHRPCVQVKRIRKSNFLVTS